MRLLLAVVLLFVATGSPALADSGPVGADVVVAQTLGERELTVVVRRVDAPGPVQVEVVGHGVGGGLRLRVLPAGGRATSETALDVPAVGVADTRLSVDRFGAWELELDDGVDAARVPFQVLQRVTPAWERAAYGGFVAAGAFLLVALPLAARRGWVVWVPVGGIVVSLTVAVTAALLSPTIPAPSTVSRVSNSDTGRPPANLVVTTDGAPVAGRPTAVELRFGDSGTGRPVDDLLVHHGALVHLEIISPGGVLAHVHPVRVAQGDYRVRFTPREAGRYALGAEIARAGGGSQLVRAELAVGGTTVDSPEPSAEGRVETGALVANRPVQLTADFGGADDLQPWLGMRGHLFIVGPGERVWAHLHALTPAAAGGQPDETVAAYPARVPFTFTFPEPGRYRLWFQAERDYRIRTISTVVDIAADGGAR
ncbi:hypothetical protein [Actinokineospora enzanensis]|uniref:hypothetical protein n=1 Tax=Actinokineospora enzanensis TaxID=155975 RepID=UPI0003808ABE|nr:hypothetical protein [Actinokineospora enzanensis]